MPNLELPEPNLELLDRVMDQIRVDREHWNQRHWAKKDSCGTSYCFAGWTCVLSGDQMNWDPFFSETSSVIVQQDSPVHFIPRRAAQLLRLSSDDAERLFSGGNTFEDLEAAVKELHNTGTLEAGARVALNGVTRWVVDA